MDVSCSSCYYYYSSNITSVMVVIFSVFFHLCIIYGLYVSSAINNNGMKNMEYVLFNHSEHVKTEHKIHLRMDDINKYMEMESIHILNLSTRIEWKCLIQIMNE